MADSTTVGDGVLTAFGAGGSKPQREFLRHIAAIAYSDWQLERAPAGAVELADRAISIGQGILTRLTRSDQVCDITDGKYAAASRTALVTAFRAAGLS